MKTNKIYDVHFNDETNSNNKGFKLTLDECMSYIQENNGTGVSYFSDYRNGTVSIVCNETSETVFETEVKTPLTIDLDEYPYAVAFETSTNYILDLKSGMGEAEYPKDQFSLDEAIADQVSMNIE